MEILRGCVIKVQLVGFALLLVAYSIHIFHVYSERGSSCIDFFRQWPRTDNKNSERYSSATVGSPTGLERKVYVQSAAICNLASRCHYILHTGPLNDSFENP